MQNLGRKAIFRYRSNVCVLDLVTDVVHGGNRKDKHTARDAVRENPEKNVKEWCEIPMLIGTDRIIYPGIYAHVRHSA